MDLTPQVLHDAEFREARRGGYDTRDVDEFLERVAGAVTELQDRLRDALQRVEAAEARAAEADRRAREVEVTGGPSEAEETLKRTLVLAQRTADAAIREAEEQAAQTLGAAREEADRALAEARAAAVAAKAEAEDEARRGAEEVRNAVQVEVEALQRARSALHDDVQALQAHVDEQRTRLQAAVADIGRLLDDPGSLRELATPELSGVDIDLTGDAATAPAPTPTPRTPKGEDWSFLDEPRPDAPQSESVDVLAESDLGDEAYLAELRKAMTDQTPLGPDETNGSEPATSLFDTEPRRRERSRFGRRA